MAINIVAEIWTELSISLLLIALRIVSRWLSVGMRSLTWDDYLMILGGLFYCADSTLAYLVGAKWKNLANNSMTNEYRAALDPAGNEYHLRVEGSKTQFMGWIFYCCVLWTLKTCWLFFYLRLGQGVSNMKLKCQIGFGLVATTFVATILVVLFGCFPVQKHWQIYPDPGKFCYTANSPLQVITVIVTNLTTDFYIMAIPLPMIWGSTIRLRNKISLIAMFCGGVITAVFGLLRCVLLLTSGIDGPALGGAWSIRECFVAMIVSNLPFLLPLAKRIRSRIRGTNGSSYESNNKASSVPLSTVKATKKSGYKRFRHPHDIPGDKSVLGHDRFGSEEAIVNMDKNSTVTTTTVAGNDKDVENGNDIVITTEWQVQTHTEDEHERVASRAQHYLSGNTSPVSP